MQTIESTIWQFFFCRFDVEYDFCCYIQKRASAYENGSFQNSSETWYIAWVNLDWIFNCSRKLPIFIVALGLKMVRDENLVKLCILVESLPETLLSFIPWKQI